MDRRGFLKNSIGALLFAGLSSNKVLASVVETLTPDSPKVLLYLIQKTSGQWQIRATKWVDLYKQKRLKPCHVNKDTFEALDIVDYENATKRKYELWKQYNCTGKLTPVKIVENTIAGKKSLTSKNYIEYLKSDKFKENQNKRNNAAIKANKNQDENLRKLKSEYAKKYITGRKHSEETKKKMSLKTIGRKKSEESKQKTREWMIINNPFRGKKHSEEIKKKISESKKGKKVFRHVGNEKQVICYSYPNMEYVKEFDNLYTASNQLQIYRHSIRLTCVGKRKSTGGYTFRYKETV